MTPEDDRVTLCDYDPSWSGQFSALAARVQATLGALALAVEHVGSTAVPGLAAKPVIDFDVVLSSATALPETILRLGTLGYVHEGDLGITGREAFRWPPAEPRHHLYVLLAEATELRRHLAFRDALRADSALRDEYAALKASLALGHSRDRRKYTEAKSAFIARIVGG